MTYERSSALSKENNLSLDNTRMCDLSFFFGVSHREKLVVVSKAEGYEKALLTLNKKGRTPLHEIILNCTCTDTILFLLETPERKKAAAIKDKYGKTPYDMFLEVCDCYEKNVAAADFILKTLNVSCVLPLKMN